MEVSTLEKKTNPLTAREMYRIVETHYKDLGPLAYASFPEFFSFVSHIPFRTDRNAGLKTDEILSRPLYLLDANIFSSLDCKKKSELICAWARSQNPPLPYRLLGISEKSSNASSIHHVFPQIDFGHGWINCDATFSSNRIGQGFPAIKYAMEFSR